MVDKELCEVNHKNINEKIDRLECKHGEDMKRLEGRVDKLENIYQTLTKLTFEVSQMRLELNSLIPRVTELEDIPAKRWETVSRAVLLSIITGIVGYLIAVIGLK